MKNNLTKIIVFAVAFIMLAMPTVCYAAETDDAYLYYTFNENSGKDYGTAGADATAVGEPVITAKADGEAGPAGSYLVINPEHYLKVAKEYASFGTDDFTISFWFKAPKSTPEGEMIRVLQTGYWGAASPGFALAIFRGHESTAIAQGIAVTDTDQGTWDWHGATPEFFDDTWHLITAVFDQTNKVYSVYVDGVLGQTRNVADIAVTADATFDMALGFFECNGSPTALAGTQISGVIAIDDIAIWKKVLTADEIAAYYADPAPAENTPEEPTGDPDNAPQTGFATAALAVLAVMSGAVIIKKRH